MEEIRKKIRELARSIENEYGVQVVDVEMKGSVRRPTVMVFIDKEDGVTLDDCERFSRAFSTVLDVEDPIRSSFALEVSSPGLDRPLKNIMDFEKNTGKLVRIVIKNSLEKQNFFVGRIKEVSGGSILLSLENKKEIEIDFEDISKARLEIEFK